MKLACVTDMLWAVHRGKELDALLGLLRSDDYHVRRATEAACTLTRDLKHEAAAWDGVRTTEEQSTEQRVRRMSVVARRVSVAAASAPLSSMILPPVAPAGRRSAAFAEGTSVGPLDVRDIRAGSPSRPAATLALRADPYQFEALRAQMEHAEMQHAELESALQVSRAAELALQQQLDAVQAELRRAKKASMSTGKRPEAAWSKIPETRDASQAPSVPSDRASPTPIGALALLRNPASLLPSSKKGHRAAKEKKAKSVMKAGTTRIAPKPATIVAVEAPAASIAT
jgi:hypothetical protein